MKKIQPCLVPMGFPNAIHSNYFCTSSTVHHQWANRSVFQHQALLCRSLYNCHLLSVITLSVITLLYFLKETLWTDIFSSTVAALCNAHAFQSAHPQSYVIAHKLLICRFEVNCLHINPIIGEMWLIYINFEQNFILFQQLWQLLLHRDLFTNRIFYFQSVCAKTRFP